MHKWGPYSKKYFGVSRITESEIDNGARFDFIVSPAMSNSDTRMPNVTLPVGWHPWCADSSLSFYSYRVDLEWKDVVYSDVSFVRLDDESTLVRTEIVNNSSLMQNCLINCFSALEYPYKYKTEAILPEKSVLINAVEYEIYHYELNSPWNEQTCDGFHRGEITGDEFTSHYGLGDNTRKQYRLKDFPAFGTTKGDAVNYKYDLSYNFDNPVLAVRYRSADENNASFLLNGKEIILNNSSDFYIEYFPIEANGSIELISNGTGGVEIDFLCIIEKNDKIRTEIKKYNYTPSIKNTLLNNGAITETVYDGVEKPFVLRTFNNKTRFRQIPTGCLEDCPTSRLSQADESLDNMLETFSGSFSEKHSDEGYYHNTIVHSLFIEPNESCVEYVVISYGKTEYKSAEEYEKIYLAAKNGEEKLKYNEAGKKYAFSNEILKATMLTNVVYPLYKQGKFVVHHTPGKRWDSFYSWDSGFIGLDMLYLSKQNAKYILDTYLTDETNKDFAFLLHGSPVPVHIYQLFEMLNMENDKTLAFSYYKKAKQYYDFLCGKIRGSWTAKFKNSLTTTFDYFYNCSGMDDLPPQVEMYNRSIQSVTAPVISSSQVIRCAKILKIMADKLLLSSDVEQYNSDISRLTNALNNYSWDEESGYFSYVVHNENGEPVEKLKTADGENLNKTIDGIYPLIAGAVTNEQKKKILSHLKSEKEMMSKVGISAVNMTASYYADNGYWNGNVWFSHQWFIWKTMLDLGESDFAFKIAETALNAWKKECEYSYYTFEMVNIKTERGGWFHNFGGLSSPVNLWSFAYFTPGTFNVGFDCFVNRRSFENDNTSFSAELEYYGNNEKYTVLAVMNDKKDYSVFVNGKKANYLERKKGIFEITLDGKTDKAKIEIK